MTAGSRIARVYGRRLWDSRGLPALEAEVRLEGGAVGRAVAPAAGLPAPGEPIDLRDAGAAFGGQDVTRALTGLGDRIAAVLAGIDAADQETVDRRLIGLDGTADRGRLGSPTMFAVSLACAEAAAAADGVPLWQHLARENRPGPLPLPRVQLLDAGLTPANGNDIAGVWLIAVGADDVASALDWSSEVTRSAATLLAQRGRGAPLSGPRGALRWAGVTADELIELSVRAIEVAGFMPGEDLALAIDVRAWRFGQGGRYRIQADGRETDTRGMIDRYLGWLRRYPIVSLVDPLGMDEIAGVAALTAAAGGSVEIALGDAILGDPRRLAPLALEKAGNALVLKPGQVSSLTELKAAFADAREAGWGTILSARTGESEAGWLVHLAVGWGIGQMAVGGLARGERVAKWNEALRLAETLPTSGTLPPRAGFPW